jgi:hypothetical protein
MNLSSIVDETSPLIITGIRSIPPEIRIHGKDYKAIWSWDPWKAKDVPKWAKQYIGDFGRSVTELKWARSSTGGNKVKIIAIVNCAAIVLDYEEKTLDFIAPVTYSHTLELLPHGYLAIATTGSTQKDGIEIYDTKLYDPGDDVTSMPKPVQIIENFPVIHGLVFDHHSGILWAAGNNEAPDTKQGSSQPVLRAYAMKNIMATSGKHPFDQKPCHDFKVCEPAKLDIEWEGTAFSSWWDGAHDLIPVPASLGDSRILLITTDLDVYVFDTKDVLEPKFQRAEDVVFKYLPGFVPVGERTGANGRSLPRSDIKALSINAAGDYIYVQSMWKNWFANLVRIITDGDPKRKHDIDITQTVYVSRWFAAVPGWSSE